MLELVELLALLQDLDEIAPGHVDGIPGRRHLQLDRVQPELFDRARAADAAIADEGTGLRFHSL